MRTRRLMTAAVVASLMVATGSTVSSVALAAPLAPATAAPATAAPVAADPDAADPDAADAAPSPVAAAAPGGSAAAPRLQDILATAEQFAADALTAARQAAAEKAAADKAAADKAAADKAAADKAAAEKAAEKAAADKVAAEKAAAERAQHIASTVGTATESAAAQGISQSVVVIDRASGEVLAAVNPDAVVPSMSLMKLFIAADALTSAGGAEKLDQVTRDDLNAIISASNDTIASNLYASNGGSAIIERTVNRYGLTGTSPAPNPRYWGNVQITAADMASFLRQALADPVTADFIATAMTGATDLGADGFDQSFGMNAVTGAGSKQGWGCCLSGVEAIHSVGFTADAIVVVLSTSAPGSGTSAATQAVTATAAAALA